MEINKYEILLAIEEDPKTVQQLEDHFGQPVSSWVDNLSGQGLISPGWNETDLIEITARGKLELDSDFCESCECSPCDCNWGTDE